MYGNQGVKWMLGFNNLGISVLHATFQRIVDELVARISNRNVPFISAISLLLLTMILDTFKYLLK